MFPFSGRKLYHTSRVYCSRNIVRAAYGTKVEDNNNSSNCKILRSVLYMPGSNQRALEKSKTINADAFIYDFEDAVSPDAKEIARQKVLECVSNVENLHNKEIIIRINGRNTPWFEDDIAAVVQAHCNNNSYNTLLLPKVECAKDIYEVEKLIENNIYKIKKNDGSNPMKIWCMIETPKGIVNLNEICNASEKIECLVTGTVDLANDLRCSPEYPNRSNLSFALQQIIMVGRANNKIILDGVYVHVKDDEGFKAECVQGKLYGFDGKTLIHPKTVDMCNEIFYPSIEELAKAEAVVAAYEKAVQEGSGVAVVDGKLVEILHYRTAQRILNIKEKIHTKI